MAQPIRIGTSGFSYDEWKPDFYPPDLPDDERLRYYAERLPTVEIDATFYRMPTPALVDRWLSQTHDDFRIALKASRKITHRERLALPSDALAYLTATVAALGSRLGAVLYQLPPFFHFDAPRLAAFLDALPRGLPGAFAFRHPSWFTDVTYRLLSDHGVALCVEDSDEQTTPLEITARFTYVRLRRTSYGDDALEAWRRRVSDWAERGIDVLAFVKHEGEPLAPVLAQRLAGLWSVGQKGGSSADRAIGRRARVTTSTTKRLAVARGPRRGAVR